MAGTQISTSVSIISALNGFQAVSLTNFNTSAESQIAAGSKVELASAFFTFASDEQPSGWSSIATASTAYITLTPSGSAGTQIVSAAYSSTVPEWSDSKQGWYTSALSATRYVGRVYKTSATQYDDAVVLLPHQGTTGPVVVAETLNVTGDATIGGALETEGITANGAIAPSQVSASSQNVNFDQTYLLARGIWVIVSAVAGFRLEILVGGTWYRQDDDFYAGTVFSDGSNARLYQALVGTRTFYYLRF